MAEREVNQILEGIKTAIAGRQAQQQLEQNQQRLDTEKQYRTDEAARWEKQYEIEKQRIQAEQELQHINRDLLFQKVQDNYMQTGVLPPGVTSTPTPGTPGQEAIPSLGMPAIPPQPGNWAILNFPGYGETEVPTPDAYLKQQISNAEALEGPKRTTQAALQSAETLRQISLQEAEGRRRLSELAQEHQNKLTELAKSDEYETARQAAMIKAANWRDQQNNITRLREASLNSSGGLLDLPGYGGSSTGNPSMGVHITTGADGAPQFNTPAASGIYKNAIDDATNLRLSSDEFEKRYKKMSPALMTMAREQGIGFASKANVDKFKDYDTVSKVLPQIREMVQLRATYPNEVWMPGTDAFKQYQKNMDIVGGNIPAISRILSDVKRFNTPEMEKYQDMLVPRRNPFTSNSQVGIEKFNDFVQTLQNGARKTLSELPQGHQDHVIDNLGLNNYPYLNKTYQAPGQKPNPKIGDVVSGWRFIGGDPADKTNWKPASKETMQPTGR